MANQYHKYVDRLQNLGINNCHGWMYTENGLLPITWKNGMKGGRRHMTPFECVEAGGEFERALEDLITSMERKNK